MTTGIETSTPRATSTPRGTLARLIPYHRTAGPRDALYHLWDLMEAQGGGPLLFHGQLGPESVRGDLIAFTRMLAPQQGDCYVLLAAKPDVAQLEGFIWFDDVVHLGAHTRAAINVFYRRRFWGAPARDATRQALRYGVTVLGFHSIWGWSPWPNAVRHARAVGMTVMAELPGFATGGRDLTIVRATREEILGE